MPRIGLARLHTHGEVDAMLARIQNDLFDLGADLCVPETSQAQRRRLRIVDAQVERLEREIDAMNAELSPLHLLRAAGRHAGGGLSASGAHDRAARRAADGRNWRRTKRSAPPAIKYINRLSDHLFVASRFVNDKGAKDVLWTPGANR